MQLTRLYERNKEGGFVRDKGGDLKVCAVEIKRAPLNGIQHLSTRLVARAIEEGWITLSDDSLTITNSRRVFKLDKDGEKVLDDDPDPNARKYIVLGTEPHGDDLVFKVNRTPGTYCCHTGDKIDNDPSGAKARAYIAENFEGVESPNPEWPAGYEVIHYFDCEVI